MYQTVSQRFQRKDLTNNMAYTTINKHTDHFNTKLYTGNGSTQSITGVGFQPDFVWHKYRGGTGGHNLFDAVRGATKRLRTNTNGAEGTGADTLTSFDSDGFSLGADTTGDGVNINGYSNVTWNWKAGNSAGSTNNDGSVTSTVSANTTAGFSICKFDFPSSGNFTFGHGLGVAPKMFILKGYTATANWQTYNEAKGNTWNTQINYNSSSSSGANWWGSTSPTSTVCTVGADLIESGQTAIAYCFAEKTGYSKFGMYTGNGNADGTFVYTGFKPAFILVKNTSNSQSWYLLDTKRDIYNPMRTYLHADGTSGDQDHVFFDFYSNGFKARNTVSGYNSSGDNYIYMVFGQSLVGSNNVPCTAR